MKSLEQLAREAGIVDQLNMGAASCVYSHGCNGVTQEHLERFHAAVRAEVLEEAALIADEEAKGWRMSLEANIACALQDCAAAIREAKGKA